MIFDLFSKRQAKQRGQVADVFTYDEIPHALKVQVVHIWRDTLGDGNSFNDPYVGGSVRDAYKFIVETLCREYGVFSLVEANGHQGNSATELLGFFLAETNPEKVLDVVELSFTVIDHFTRRWDYRHDNNASENADAAIKELNDRFRQHGVGYQFDGGKIIRVDSQIIHAEAVKPALTLLSDPKYAGAEKEFLAAHEHYRHGKYEEALNECLKAFESTMKIICSKRGWTHDPNATSKDLIKVLFDNDLIPAFWNSHFAGLRSTLEAGVPTARNRMGGHGQGTEIREVPQYITSYVLHLTASAIVFLGEAEKAKGR